jgi:hypothetical protein
VLLQDVVDAHAWQAFGAIAVEVELVTGACRAP